MKIGYARVSTLDQNPELQLAALRQDGCERLFIDKASGADRERPQLFKALNFVQKGDVFVCWKLDRVARSTTHLLQIAESLDFRGATFRCLTQPIDTSSAYGRMTFTILAAVAEFERDLIQERTRAGMAVARAKGKTFGRKTTVSGETRKKIIEARNIGLSARGICDSVGISVATYYRVCKEMNGDGASQ